MRNQRRQNLNTHLNSQSAQAAAQLQGSQMQQMQQQQQQQRSSETSLAIALMGIVIMHIGIDFSFCVLCIIEQHLKFSWFSVCQLLRVFLAGLAVYFVHDTLWCIKYEGGFAPPLWTMCAESISSLLIMINFSGIWWKTFFDSSDMMFAFSLEAQVKRNCIAARVRKIGAQNIPCYPILEIRFPYGLVLTFQSILHPTLLVKERHSILNHDLQNALFFQVTFSHLPMINHFQFPLSR